MLWAENTRNQITQIKEKKKKKSRPEKPLLQSLKFFQNPVLSSVEIANYHCHVPSIQNKGDISPIETNIQSSLSQWKKSPSGAH